MEYVKFKNELKVFFFAFRQGW